MGMYDVHCERCSKPLKSTAATMFQYYCENPGCSRYGIVVVLTKEDKLKAVYTDKGLEIPDNIKIQREES